VRSGVTPTIAGGARTSSATNTYQGRSTDVIGGSTASTKAYAGRLLYRTTSALREGSIIAMALAVRGRRFGRKPRGLA
jgi:hypothetical protein